MDIEEWQRRYYQTMLQKHGPSPQALGWNDRETQTERFMRLTRLFDHETEPFSLHEIGCGLGDLGVYLKARSMPVEYSGSDVVSDFVEASRQRHPEGQFHVRDLTNAAPGETYDYLTLSGTFNPRFEGVETFSRDMLCTMYAMCRRGMAVNFLTSYADPERMRPDLHYADPLKWFDFASRTLSRHVEIDAAGPLFEFTMRIFRPEYVQKRYASPTFDKYFACMKPGTAARPA
ncbi:MAG: class I SAM-dependent methyltransferase [bacterium]